MDLAAAKVALLQGKKIRFDLTDGYGIIMCRFGSVTMNIVNTATGESSSFTGDFIKVQKTFAGIMGEDAEFYIVEGGSDGQ